LTGLEDIDLGIKAKKSGWEVFYSSEADVEHLHKENYKTIQNRYRREAEAMKNIDLLNPSNSNIIKNTLAHCFMGFLRGVKYDFKKFK
jgi:GT2 family glycosyltransferase